jgi:tetratricopeptide (TPR) repeat protein
MLGGKGPRYEASSGPYDRLPEAELEQVAEARALLEDGLPEVARAILARIAARRAENIPLAIMLQEVELELAGPAGRAELAAAAALRADTLPTPVTLLLAARIDDDPARARERVEAALEIDGRCAWAHYALAHLEARSGDWVEAGRRLERALARDPGLLPGRRLEAAFLARDGKHAEAIRALLHWLELTESDPLVDPTQRFLAGLDLAQLQLLEGEEGRARAVLLGLTDEPEEYRARRLVILAAVEQARDNPESALRAARRAEAVDAFEPLAVVQQAELYESWLDDPVRAREKWERLIDIASSSGDLSALLLGMRARVALERFDSTGSSRGTARP